MPEPLWIYLLEEAAWVWSNKDRKVLLGGRWSSASGRLARAACPSPAAWGSKGAPPRMPWPWSS